MHFKKNTKKLIAILGIVIALIIFIIWMLIQHWTVPSQFQYFVKNLDSSSADITQSDFETQFQERLNEFVYYYAKYGEENEEQQTSYLDLAEQSLDYIVLKYMDLEQEKEENAEEKLLVILYPQNQEYVPIIFPISYGEGQLSDTMAARKGVQEERLDFQSIQSQDGKKILQTYLEAEKQDFCVWYQGTVTLDQVTKPSYEDFTGKEQKLEELESWAESGKSFYKERRNFQVNAVYMKDFNIYDTSTGVLFEMRKNGSDETKYGWADYYFDDNSSEEVADSLLLLDEDDLNGEWMEEFIARVKENAVYSVQWTEINEISVISKVIKGETDILYLYDDNARRIYKNVGGVESAYEYEENRLLRETVNGHVIQYEYENYKNDYFWHFTGCIIDGERYDYIRNEKNYIVGMQDVDGQLKVSYEYDEDGSLKAVYDVKEDNSKELCSDEEFVGNLNHIVAEDFYWDAETGWYYYYTTYYNPQTKRSI